MDTILKILVSDQPSCDYKIDCKISERMYLGHNTCVVELSNFTDVMYRELTENGFDVTYKKVRKWNFKVVYIVTMQW